GLLGVVDGFAARETGQGGGAVCAGEDQDREQSGVVQVGGEGGDAQVMAAQADPGIAPLSVAGHLVVVPDDVGVLAVGVADLHAVVSFRVGPGCAAWWRIASMARSWWDRPLSAASWAASPSR